MKYIQRYDGKGFTVEAGKVTRWACCSCGLVHDIAFVASEDGKEIGVAAKVNNRATAARRKKHKQHESSQPKHHERHQTTFY